METFRSVKIIHNIEDRMDFLFLAEFFHFCGLYVGEGIASMPDTFEKADPSCFDVIISIQAYEKYPEYTENPKKYSGYRNLLEMSDGFVCLKDIFGRKHLYIPGHKDETDFYNDEAASAGRGFLLEDSLRECFDKLGIKWENTEWESTLWPFLIEVYIKYNLMLYSSSLQYYQHSPVVAIQEATVNMMNAYDELEAKRLEACTENKIEKERSGMDYAEYARIWCAVKANAGFAYQRKTLFFPPQELAEAAERLYQNYPDFSNAIVLQGLCYENSKDKANEAIAAFNRALDQERLHCYATAIYYWLGKRYEAYDARQKEAEYYYQKAYEKKKKFRNLYKLAIYAERWKDYGQAEQYYLQIIKALKQKREKHMEDPLELEYEFKAYRHMCMMYFKKCKNITVRYRKTIEYADKAIEVREQSVKNSLAYEYLYGKTRADEYRALSRSRMDLKYVYHILFLTYDELQEYDLARSYRDKAQISKS